MLQTEGREIESRRGEFFNLPNPSSRTMVLGSTQPLTEMTTRNLPGWPARKADKLTAICEPTVWKMWEPRESHNPMSHLGLLQGMLYLLYHACYTHHGGRMV
jgi:hypothetical protein